MTQMKKLQHPLFPRPIRTARGLARGLAAVARGLARGPRLVLRAAPTHLNRELTFPLVTFSSTTLYQVVGCFTVSSTNYPLPSCGMLHRFLHLICMLRSQAKSLCSQVVMLFFYCYRFIRRKCIVHSIHTYLLHKRT